MSEEIELIENRNMRYPPELGLPEELIIKANIDKIILKFKVKIEELELRIIELEKKLLQKVV